AQPRAPGHLRVFDARPAGDGAGAARGAAGRRAYRERHHQELSMRPLVAAGALTLGAALCCAPSPAFALAEVKGETRSLELTGNVRLLAGFLHVDDALVPLVYTYTDDGIAAAVGRLILKGALANDVDYEVHGFLDIGRAPVSPLLASGGTS